MDQALKAPNVLLLAGSFDVGGTEAHVRLLANELSDLGATVIVASRAGRQNDLLDESIPFVDLHLCVKKAFTNLLLIRSIIRSNDIKVIHAHSRKAIKFSAFVSFIFRVPLVVTAHGRVGHDIRSKFARFKVKHLILVNNNTYHQIKHWPVLGKKLVVVPNGSSIFDLPYDQNSETVSFVYVSRMSHKHFHALKVLIAVFSSEKFVNQTQLKIVGDGKFSEQLRIHLKSHGSKNISYVGYQSDPSEFLKECHVVMGVGRVAIEGLCAGKAVYTLNGVYRGQLATSDNFSLLKSSNFVNVRGEVISEHSVIQDITDIISKFHSGTLPRKAEIGAEKIESLSIREQVMITIKVYLSAIGNR